MADPITALSIAAAILQLVDLGGKLLVTGYEAYKSIDGTSQRNVHIEVLITDLEALHGTLTKRSSAAVGSLSGDELALRELAGRGQTLAKKLIKVLGELKVKGKGLYRTWGAIRQTVKATWKKAEIEALYQCLQELQMQVNSRLLGLMRDEQCSLFTEVDKLTTSCQSIDQNVRKALDRTKAEIVAAVERHNQDMQLAYDTIWSDTMVNQKDVFQHYSAALDNISSRLDSFSSQVDNLEKNERILNSLSFPDIHAREGLISDARDGTFQWMFGDAVPFRRWLEKPPSTQQDGVFLLCGKAGSGKSTLMRHLVESSRTQRYLRKWAGDAHLVVASFFFWNSGSVMQRSHQGLLQSLLFQLLRQCPERISTAAPDRWAVDRASLSFPKEWTCTELCASITRTLQKGAIQERFCFFIDGLDEFEGHPPDLIEALDNLRASPAVKLCVSSRPRTAFVDMYGGSEHPFQITLQDHTAKDIKAFVEQRLMRNHKFAELAQHDSHAYDVAETIQKKSSGVFLWVVLVVQEVLDGVYERDSVSQLFDRINHLPTTLEDMFARVLDGIHPVYHRQMARLLLISVHAHEPLPVPAACFLEGEASDQNTELPSPTTPLLPAEFTRMQAATKINVSKWCRDLLEIRLNHSYGSREVRNLECGTWDLIVFTHRSVRDYLRLPEVEAHLRALAGPGFDPITTNCRIWFCWLSALDTSSALRLGHVFAWYDYHDIASQILALARLVEMHNGFTPSALLDRVDVICNSHFVQRHGHTKHWTSAMIVTDQPIWNTAQSSFLSFAASHGLEIYLRQKLEAEYNTELPAAWPYMLDAALRKLYMRPMWDVEYHPHTRLVGLLVSRGADVNHAFDLDPTFVAYAPISGLDIEVGPLDEVSKLDISSSSESSKESARVPRATIWQLYLSSLDETLSAEQKRAEMIPLARSLANAGADDQSMSLSILTMEEILANPSLISCAKLGHSLKHRWQ